MVKRVFLWTSPRCCSSAFERSIMTLSTTKVFKSEPFAQAYYFGPQRQSSCYKSQEIDPNLSYEDVAKAILDQPVEDGIEIRFIKDMAYFMEGKFNILEEYFKDDQHSFLIRDPEKVIPSLYRASKHPEIYADGWNFDPNENKFRTLHEMYKFVEQNSDSRPLVVDADDLLESPKQMMKEYCDKVGIIYEDHMTTWEPTNVIPEPWKNTFPLAWRRGALNSSGFTKAIRPGSSTSAPDVTYPEDAIKMIKEWQPFYEKLYSARIRLM